jgi:hypothetical protein
VKCFAKPAQATAGEGFVDAIRHPSFFRERSFVCVKALDLTCKSNKKFKITFKKQCKNPETIKRCWKSPGHFWRRVLLIFTSILI